jgi:hypothetical protein
LITIDAKGLTAFLKDLGERIEKGFDSARSIPHKREDEGGTRRGP